MKDTELIQFELFERYPDVLTVHQAREALGVGRTGVYKLIDQGLLKSLPISVAIVGRSSSSEGPSTIITAFAKNKFALVASRYLSRNL